jgi:hypothetical protein
VSVDVFTGLLVAEVAAIAAGFLLVGTLLERNRYKQERRTQS